MLMVNLRSVYQQLLPASSGSITRAAMTVGTTGVVGLSPYSRRDSNWLFFLPWDTLTLVLLVSDDDEESDAGAKGVDSNGHFAQHARDLPADGPHDLLVGPLVAGL